MRRKLRPWQEPGADPYLFDKYDEHQSKAHERRITNMMEGGGESMPAPRTPRRERGARPKPIGPAQAGRISRGPRRRVAAARESPEVIEAINRSRAKMPKPMAPEDKADLMGAVASENMANAAAVEGKAAAVPRRRGRRPKEREAAGPFVDFDALAKRHRLEEGESE